MEQTPKIKRCTWKAKVATSVCKMRACGWDMWSLNSCVVWSGSRSGVVIESGLKPHHVDSLSTTTAVAELHHTNPVRYFQPLTVATEPRLVLNFDGTKHMHLKVMRSEIAVGTANETV